MGYSKSDLFLMKLQVACTECSIGKSESEYTIMEVEVRDDGIYEVKCPNGHTDLTFLEHFKFEILFEIGTHAIVDGYYREAISSFSSSLERFYEFVTKVILFESRIDENTINHSWKKVSNQSERQLGAFIILFTSCFGKTPKLMSNPKIAFRNEVIHKGKIPIREEAIEFGQAVLDIVNPILLEIVEGCPNGIEMIKETHLNRLVDQEAKYYSKQWINTIVNLLKSSNRNKDIVLDTYIKQLEIQRNA